MRKVYSHYFDTYFTDTLSFSTLTDVELNNFIPLYSTFFYSENNLLAVFSPIYGKPDINKNLIKSNTKSNINRAFRGGFSKLLKISAYNKDFYFGTGIILDQGSNILLLLAFHKKYLGKPIKNTDFTIFCSKEFFFNKEFAALKKRIFSFFIDDFVSKGIPLIIVDSETIEENTLKSVSYAPIFTSVSEVEKFKSSTLLEIFKNGYVEEEGIPQQEPLNTEKKVQDELQELIREAREFEDEVFL